MPLYEEITFAVTDIIDQYKEKISDNSISFSEAWTLSYNVAATLIQFVERYSAYDGLAKKQAVLQALDRVYDELIAPLDITAVPNMVEPMVDRVLKNLMLSVVGSSIDSIVALLNRTGWLPLPKKAMGGMSDSPDRLEMQEAPGPQRLDFPVI